jgi:hypothetical protein
VRGLHSELAPASVLQSENHHDHERVIDFKALIKLLRLARHAFYYKMLKDNSCVTVNGRDEDNPYVIFMRARAGDQQATRGI